VVMVEDVKRLEIIDGHRLWLGQARVRASGRG